MILVELTSKALLLFLYGALEGTIDFSTPSSWPIELDRASLLQRLLCWLWDLGKGFFESELLNVNVEYKRRTVFMQESGLWHEKGHYECCHTIEATLRTAMS